jgi:hypothetical protein
VCTRPERTGENLDRADANSAAKSVGPKWVRMNGVMSMRSTGSGPRTKDRLGMNVTAEHERYLLSALHQGLEVMEFDRGQLREVDSRAGLTRGERSALHEDVLDVLFTCARSYPRRAAEIAWWLMESLHRAAMSDAIRRGGYRFNDAELERLLNDYDQVEAECRWVSIAEAMARKVPAWKSSPKLAVAREKLRDKMSDIFTDAVSGDPVELDDLYRRLDGRVGLYYHYRKTDNEWHITAVLVSHIGTQLHRTKIPDTEPDPTAHPLRSPQGLLRCLAEGDDQHIEELATSTFLQDENAWPALAREILPPDLGCQLHLTPGPSRWGTRAPTAQSYASR